ncbi:hypothetical protein [Metamycoplasma hyosynoviae]|nr:hypothetical protein [Metamycoplasma hyosynoviae]MDD1359122.1 hypothetical protein [Metamycoplasma hyosynoviae]
MSRKKIKEIKEYEKKIEWLDALIGKIKNPNKPLIKLHSEN